MDEIFENIGDYIKILISEHSYSPEFFKKIEVSSRIERKEKTDYIHAHLFIVVNHYSKIHLNIAQIHDKICEDLDFKNRSFKGLILNWFNQLV